MARSRCALSQRCGGYPVQGDALQKRPLLERLPQRLEDFYEEQIGARHDGGDQMPAQTPQVTQELKRRHVLPPAANAAMAAYIGE